VITIAIPLRDGGTGSVPFPPELVVAGDVVLACSGVDRPVDDAPDVSVRTLLAGFDVRSGEQRFLLDVFHGGKEPPAPDQVSLPGVSEDGHIAQLLRRGEAVSLNIGSPSGRRVTEIEPTVARLLRAEEAVLSRPIPAPGGSWVASWGLRNPDPRRLRSHRTECLREGGPPLWWADDERVLGSVGDIVITRAVGEAMVGHAVGRRIGTGAPAWETDFAPGSRVELLGDLVLVMDRSRRARERGQRYDAFIRHRMERISNDPIASRNVDWAAEESRAFHELGKLLAGPVRGIDARTGAVRFRIELPGDPVGPVAGGAHVACVVVVDEEGVGGVFRYRAADGAELGRRGFHVEDHFHAGPAQPSLQFPELIGADHTHLLWLDGRTELVCEILSDPGREVWRLSLPHVVVGTPMLGVSEGRIFLRDAESLRIFSEES